MKLEKPPIVETSNFQKYFDAVIDPKVYSFLRDTEKRYLYWSELKHRPNLPIESPIDVWELTKIHRELTSKRIYFHSARFNYNLTSFIQKDLHEFDLKLIGGLYKDSITPQDQKEYFKNSLIEEAIASSQIEGAATTTDIARDMIKSGRNPRNESEQMIFNNFSAIREIETRLDDSLNEQLILDIHSIMTNKTEASIYSGKFRTGPIYVKDHIDGEIAHTAPDYKQVDALIVSLCNFINEENEFIHPIIKASILHFMIGYIHPFGDGNGRTARALFYWHLMKKDYSLMRHISISRAILNSRTSYDKAFLKTEQDDNDLTYFIMYSIKSLRVAFESLVHYRDKKRDERAKASEIAYELIKKGLNKRQSDLLGYLFNNSKSDITIPVYSEKHDIVRQTGSKDLLELEKMGIIEGFRDGKNLVYKLVSIKKIEDLLNKRN